MNLRPPSSGSSPPSFSGSDRLDSWKEIARHLKRDVRTAQRWEASEGLPVYRHQHGKHDSVYAYRSEVDTWWAGRRPSVQKQETQKDAHEQEVQKRQHQENRRDFDSRIQLNLPRHLRLILYVLLIIVIALAVEEVRRLLQEHSSGKPISVDRAPTLAVVPFRNLSTDLDTTQFALGMTDDVIGDLRKAGTLRVINRTFTMPFQNSPELPGQIARQLRADKVVLGTVARSDGRIHIVAQLVDGPSGQLLWSQQFDRSDLDLLSIQANVAGAIATAVETTLLPDNSAALGPPHAPNAEARIDNFKAPRFRYFWKRKDSAELLEA